MKNNQNDSIYYGLATSSLSLFDTLAIKNACRDRLADGPSIFFRFSKILMKLGGPGGDPRTTFSIIFSTRPLWGFPGGPRGRQNDPQGRQNEPQGCQKRPPELPKWTPRVSNCSKMCYLKFQKNASIPSCFPMSSGTEFAGRVDKKTT